MKNTLTLSFTIREDLPSERAQEYRQLVIDALFCLRSHGTNLSTDKFEMINRILWDHEEDPDAQAFIDARRALIRLLDQGSVPDGQVVDVEDIINTLDSRLSVRYIE